MRNTYFVTCPFCGSNLDPGERCDCQNESEVKTMTPEEKARQTRKKHTESRKRKENEEKRLRESMKRSCQDMIEDLRLSPKERLEALKILHELTKGR